MEGEIHQAVPVAYGPGPEGISRIERKLHRRQELQAAFPPDAVFVVALLVFDLVVGEVEAAQPALGVAAASGGPVPLHHVGVVALVHVHQAVAVRGGEDRNPVGQDQGAFHRPDELVGVQGGALPQGETDDQRLRVPRILLEGEQPVGGRQVFSGLDVELDPVVARGESVVDLDLEAPGFVLGVAVEQGVGQAHGPGGGLAFVEDHLPVGSAVEAHLGERHGLGVEQGQAQVVLRVGQAEVLPFFQTQVLHRPGEGNRQPDVQRVDFKKRPFEGAQMEPSVRDQLGGRVQNGSHLWPA
jgi:hypothetical protein